MPTAVALCRAIPVRPLCSKQEPVTAAIVRNAFRAVYDEDWQLCLRALRASGCFWRHNAVMCPEQNRPMAHSLVWQALLEPARMLAETVDGWRVLEPAWRPDLRCTWREWLHVHFALVYGDACWQGAPAERLDELARSLGQLVLAGERRAP
jgi:hypothetical protein